MRKRGRKLKKNVGLLLALSVLALETASVNAAELPEVIVDVQTGVSDVAEDDGLVYATVAMPEIMPLLASGEVVGNSVRLRQGPNSSTTVLELMYYGEIVIIDETISSAVPGGYWYYVMRAETGTWGWVSSAYIYKF